MPSTGVDDTPLVRVAAGLIRDPAGALLTQERPQHQPYAGFWEFPGGKIEPGENPASALARELEEELGVTVRAAAPLLVYRHRYRDKRVELHVWRIDRFAGQPRPVEGQHLAWRTPSELAGMKLLRGNRVILRALGLPPLYAITAAHRYGTRAQLEWLDEALSAGLAMLQVREPGMSPRELAAFLGEVAARCDRHGARLLLSDRHAGAAPGVHLTGDGLARSEGRPAAGLAAASCHDAAQLRRAGQRELDFAVLGPVAPTASHAGARQSLGWDAFSGLVRAAPLPVYALGGVTAADFGRARDAGALGIAMISGLWEAGPARVLAAVHEAEASSRSF